MRTYNQVFPNYQKHILEIIKKVADVDVFIDTWDLLCCVYTNANHNAKCNDALLMQPTNEEQVREMYRPTAMRIENYDSVKHLFTTDSVAEKPGLILNSNDGYSKDNILFSVPQFYKIFRCNELCRDWAANNSKSYDFILRYRPDFIMPHDLNMSIMMKNKDILYVNQIANTPRLCNMVAFGTSVNMKKYAELYLKLKSLFNRGIFADAEALLGTHLQEENVTVLDMGIGDTTCRG